MKCSGNNGIKLRKKIKFRWKVQNFSSEYKRKIIKILKLNSIKFDYVILFVFNLYFYVPINFNLV